MVYGIVPTAAWRWDAAAGAYVDLTLAVQRREGGSVAGLEQVADFLYLGFPRRFDAVKWWLASPGAYGDLRWELGGAGSDWAQFVPEQLRVFDFGEVSGYARWTVDAPGLEAWEARAFSATDPHAAAPPNAAARYWVRVSSPAGVTTAARVEAVTVRPYAYLATPRDVQGQLQLVDEFDADSLPTAHTVEEYLRGAEDGLYYLMGHYYRPEFVEAELVNFKAFGMKLRHQPILEMLALETYNGNDWVSKPEGRTQDWHYEAETGMVYASTIFLDVVPPILRRGYSERRNQGSYKRSVRVRYVHGHDQRDAPFAHQVKRIVVKQACLDTVINNDFARLIPQGLDRVTLDSKVKTWREEIEEFKDRYAKITFF